MKLNMLVLIYTLKRKWLFLWWNSREKDLLSVLIAAVKDSTKWIEAILKTTVKMVSRAKKVILCGKTLPLHPHTCNLACAHCHTLLLYKLHSCPYTHSHTYTHALHVHSACHTSARLQHLPFPQAKYLLLFRYGPEWRDNISTVFFFALPSLSFSNTPILACG